MIKRIEQHRERTVPRRNTWLMVGLWVMAATVTSGVFAAAAFAEEPANTDLAGRPILRIEYQRSNVFDNSDPATSSWPYRWANALHITTRETFIKSMILFSEGDAWDPAVAAESARILRSLDFLNPVFIDAYPEAEGVIVRIRTHDKWTLQVGAKFGIQGSRKAYSVEFDEKNFLGWGRRMTLEYQKDHERSTWTYVYSDPNLFGSRWRGRLLFANSSDGHREELLAERPFYALATPQAWGGEWKHWSQIEYLYGEGEQVAGGKRDFRLLNLWWGTRIPAPEKIIRRLNLAFHLDERRFSDWRWESSPTPFPTPDDVKISGPRLAFEQTEDRYRVLTGFRGFSAQEDIAFGSSLRAGVTFSMPGFGGDIPRLVFDGAWGRRVQKDGWLLMADIWTSGRLDEGSAANVVSGIQLAASQLGPRGWQLRLRIEDSKDLDRENQLTLGADTGLRGWDPDTFDGTGRAIFNLQWRTLLKEDFLHLFSVGIVFFGDAGKTWGARFGPGTDGIRFDAGVGLLADLTHIGVSNVLRLDLAVPDDGSGVTVIVTTTALF
ncbi:MAG: hypothetical protein DRJ65_11735 [Acidobacteria bacterium]|nr:MAG: hypothetical protein DRJ65_11735 [Acidobacteriota bacterium]